MIIKEQIFNKIQGSQRILLHLHPKPDPDSIGSALATYHALKAMGKDVTVIKGDSDLPKSFSFLPGYEDIVLKNYFEIGLDNFDLFIIQDSGSKNLISRKGDVTFPDTMATIVIDHHKTNENYGSLNLVDPTYSATAEFLFDLFVGWGIEITKDIAACLYIGIYGDTGGFRHLNTTVRTMEIVVNLCKVYPDFSDLIYQLENSNSKGRVYFDAVALNSVETFLNDSVVVSSVTFKEIRKRNITREDASSNEIGNKLISVKEWKVGVLLVENKEKEISVSMRSKRDIDVSIAATELGGGGHKNAAGALLFMDINEAKEKVVSALSKLF